MSNSITLWAEIEGLNHCFVEVSARWTRKEIRELMACTDDQALAGFFRSKMVSCHLERGTEGAEPITTVDQLIEALTVSEDLDLRLIDFVGTVLIQAAAVLRNLGNMAGRVRSPGSDSKPTPVQS